MQELDGHLSDVFYAVQTVPMIEAMLHIPSNASEASHQTAPIILQSDDPRAKRKAPESESAFVQQSQAKHMRTTEQETGGGLFNVIEIVRCPQQALLGTLYVRNTLTNQHPLF